MERRQALVVSAVATLVVLTMVGMAVALVQMSSRTSSDGDDVSDLASGLTVAPPTTVPVPTPDPVVEYQDVYEYLPASPLPATSGGSTAGSTAAPPAAAGAGATPSGPPPSAPAPTATSGSSRVTTATAAAPVTTTTTRPPGVPADWPADQPIPPMPPGCSKPQLEDDGVWNCDH